MATDVLDKTTHRASNSRNSSTVETHSTGSGGYESGNGGSRKQCTAPCHNHSAVGATTLSHAHGPRYCRRSRSECTATPTRTRSTESTHMTTCKNEASTNHTSVATSFRHTTRRSRTRSSGSGLGRNDDGSNKCHTRNPDHCGTLDGTTWTTDTPRTRNGTGGMTEESYLTARKPVGTDILTGRPRHKRTWLTSRRSPKYSTLSVEELEA